MIQAEIPLGLRRLFGEFVGVKGGMMYKGFRNGRFEYISAVLCK
jgi:hypothetical protein